MLVSSEANVPGAYVCMYYKLVEQILRHGCRVRAQILKVWNSNLLERSMSSVLNTFVDIRRHTYGNQTVVDLSHSFNELLLSMTRNYDAAMLLFDTTREARLRGHRPVQYNINQ